MDAIGVSRYLPIVVYQKGRLDNAAYIGYTLERYEEQIGKFWPPVVETTAGDSAGAVQRAVKHIKGLAGPVGKVGIEVSFLPWDAAKLLQDGLGNCQLVDATFLLERLRARKTRAELAQLREASERVVASMLAVFDRCSPGQTKNELVDRLRREEVERGLTFEYCLITGGTSLNRASSSWGVPGPRPAPGTNRRGAPATTTLRDIRKNSAKAAPQYVLYAESQKGQEFVVARPVLLERPDR
jgi:Xaa-Pro aminopeptidase